MKYDKAKDVVIKTPIGVLGVAAICYSEYMKADGDEFLFYLVLGVFVGAIIGLLSWGLGRIFYCNRYINKDIYTPNKLKALWGFSEHIELSKSMSREELIEAVNKFTAYWLPVIALDEEETIKFARAVILLRHQNLWIGTPSYPDKSIERYVSQFTTEMKVLDFFKGGD